MSGTGLKGSGAGHWIWNLHILNKLHETSPITGILNDNLDYKHQKQILENSNKTTYLLTGFCLAHGLDLKKKLENGMSKGSCRPPNTLSSWHNINLAITVQALLPPNTTSEHCH